MNCPNCKNKKISEKISIADIAIDKCSSCEGLWFEKDELRLAKDKKVKNAKWLDVEIKDKSLNWLKFELWKDKVKFKAKKDIKICPQCKIPFYQLNYGDSKVKIDTCGNCKGIWLDKNEFKKIIKYLKEKADYEVLNNYAKNLLVEFKEIFTGPENLKSEITDFIILTRLLKYKLAVQYPKIIKIFLNFPLTK